MVKLDVQPLDSANLASLKGIGDVIATKASHHEKSSSAKLEWDQIDRKADPWWKIKTLLVDSGDGIGSCHYCERSAAGEIEHVCPKSHYPELAFDFQNYVFSCGDCNRLKSDKWAVIDPVSNAITHLKRASKGTTSIAPTAGINLFLNLRIDDPLEFLHLDVETGKVVPIPGEVVGPIDLARATYTRDLLDLNSEKPRKSGSHKEKDAFMRARKGRAIELLRWAKDYDAKKQVDHSDPKLEALKAELIEKPYRMVWYQMVKQTTLPGSTSELIIELRSILERNTELKTLRP
jgi:uncharacterized protein (TIGR02646 family)